MDFRFDPSLEAFQEEVRAFFREEMRPEKVRDHRDERDLTGFDEAFERAHLRRAGKAGLLGISIPEEHGGQGKPLRYKAIVSYEAAYHDAPCIDTAATLIAPQMLAYGSSEQQAFYLPKMVSGELTVCIAYTEANAGSDLANLETRAERDAAQRFLCDVDLDTGLGCDQLVEAAQERTAASEIDSAVHAVCSKLWRRGF